MPSMTYAISIRVRMVVKTREYSSCTLYHRSFGEVSRFITESLLFPFGRLHVSVSSYGQGC